MPGVRAPAVALFTYRTGNYIALTRLELPSVRVEKPQSHSVTRGGSARFLLAAAGLFALALAFTSSAQAVSLQWHTPVTDADFVSHGGGADLLPSSMATGFYNGDSRSDVVVCSVANDSCWLYYGKPGTSGGLQMADPAITFVGPNGGFGASVSFLGDINGDGFGDLAIGAPTSVGEGGVLSGGALWIFFGRNASFLGEIGYYDANITVFGAEAGDNLGFASAAAGDLDGDGYGDFWVSAPNASEGGARVGEVLLFRGGPSLPTVLYRAGAATRVVGTVPGGEFGRVLLNSTDLNGDGRFDLVTSTTRYRDLSNTSVGAAFGFLGPFILDGRTLNTTRATMTFWGNVLTPSLGSSLAFAPNFTKEGGRILFVGAPAYSNNTSSGGSLVLFRINQSLCCQVYQMWDAVGLLYTIEANDQMGLSVAAGGDIDHDGFPDLVVGAPSAKVGGHGNAGRVYIVYGNDTDRQPVLLDGLHEGIEGRGDLCFLGNIVVMGDINGDGWADFIASSPGDNGTYAAGGSAYGFLGRPRNRPPSAYLTVFGNLTEGSEILVRVQRTDPDFDRLTWYWEGFQDGQRRSGAEQVTLNFDDEGGITLTVTIFDGTLYNTSYIVITVINAPPVCEIYAVGPVVEGSPATFAINASDPGRFDQWNALWSGPRGLYPSGVTASYEPTRGGNVTIDVVIEDDDGGVSNCTLNVLIDNVPPSVAIRGPLILYEGDTGIYTAEVVDPGITDAFFYNWTTPDGASKADNTKFLALHVGRSRIELLVTDLDGGTTLASVLVEVKGTKPDVGILGPDTAKEGDEITFEVRQYSGFSYDPLTVAWNMCIPGQVD
jgi:hypothetical protein